MTEINLDISDKSKSDYRKLAINFYSKIKADGDRVTLETIKGKLLELADHHTRNYWRRLRGAIVFDQFEKGYDGPAYTIKALQNTSTNPAPKQQRNRKITEQDYQRLFKKSSKRLQNILSIAKSTGARSSEFKNIIPLDDDKVFILGAKKTDTRGDDRIIQLNRLEAWRLKRAINDFHADLQTTTLKDYLGTVRKELAKTSLLIWPRRKPTTYSTFRHQMGSNLKADESMSDKDKSKILGHRSTKSIESYGNKTNGTGGHSIEAGECSDNIKDNKTNFENIGLDLNADDFRMR
jgi:integrase